MQKQRAMNGTSHREYFSLPGTTAKSSVFAIVEQGALPDGANWPVYVWDDGNNGETQYLLCQSLGTTEGEAVSAAIAKRIEERRAIAGIPQASFDAFYEDFSADLWNDGIDDVTIEIVEAFIKSRGISRPALSAKQWERFQTRFGLWLKEADENTAEKFASAVEVIMEAIERAVSASHASARTPPIRT